MGYICFIKPFTIMMKTSAGLRRLFKALTFSSMETFLFSGAVRTWFSNWGLVSTKGVTTQYSYYSKKPTEIVCKYYKSMWYVILSGVSEYRTWKFYQLKKSPQNNKNRKIIVTLTYVTYPYRTTLTSWKSELIRGPFNNKSKITA